MAREIKRVGTIRRRVGIVFDVSDEQDYTRYANDNSILLRPDMLVLVFEETERGWRSEYPASSLIGHRVKNGDTLGRKHEQNSQWPAWAEKLRAQELNKLNKQPREEPPVSIYDDVT